MTISPRQRLWLGLLGLAVAGGLLGLVFYGDIQLYIAQSADLSRRLKRPITVWGQPVKVELLADQIGAIAVIEPISFVKVPSRVTGVVIKVNVDVGQLVKQGDVLAEMEPIIPEGVASTARAELAQAQAGMEVARAQYDRIQTMFKEGIQSQVELENARLALSAARARYEAAVAALDRAALDVRLGTRVTSPITGVVQERFVNPGESIREDRQDFFRVGHIEQVVAVARVAEEKTPWVSLGQTADVVIDAFPNQTFAGDVMKIDPTVDPQTRTFKAYVKIDNPQFKIKPGLSAFVRLKYQTFAMTVPSLAVITNAGQSFVFVLEGDRARIRAVKVMPGVFGKRAVMDGLKEGEMVVYYKTYKLEDGDLVKLVEPPAPVTSPKS